MGDQPREMPKILISPAQKSTIGKKRGAARRTHGDPNRACLAGPDSNICWATRGQAYLTPANGQGCLLNTCFALCGDTKPAAGGCQIARNAPGRCLEKPLSRRYPRLENFSLKSFFLSVVVRVSLLFRVLSSLHSTS